MLHDAAPVSVVARAGVVSCQNGQTEGQVQRLKVLKRAMYGQAGFALLRKRMLYREQPIPIQRRKSLMMDMAA